MPSVKNNSKLSSYWMLNDIDLDNSQETDYEYVKKIYNIKNSISDFVKIITGKNIPVDFSDSDESYSTEDNIVISSVIDKNNIDSTVGLALHEASHILLTKFSILSEIESYITKNRKLFGMCESKNIPIKLSTDITKGVLNWIEDRRIDMHICNKFPGYKGYYKELYKRYFFTDEIKELLEGDLYIKENIQSYLCRFYNIMHPSTNLDLLVSLRKIYDILNLSNINRLQDTIDCFNLATDIVYIIFDSILPLTKEDLEDIDKISNMTPNKGDSSKELSDEQIKQISDLLSNLNDFINGTLKKDIIPIPELNYYINIIRSGASIENVDVHDYTDTTDNFSFDVIVLKNVNESLINSVFAPFLSTKNIMNTRMQLAIDEGILLGKKLGNKLVIRNDDRTTDYSRRKHGKIDRHLLYEIGTNNYFIFKKSEIEKYCDISFHISIDFSTSMRTGNRIEDSIRFAVAIAQMSIMSSSSINVVISVRTTIEEKLIKKPLVAILYDSKKDKIDKIYSLFKYLGANGNTPEGLCFPFIRKFMSNTSSGEGNSYFLNLSDGEPFFGTYVSTMAINHTRDEVRKFINSGINVISYFIGNNTSYKYDFFCMYGNDSHFIDTSDLIQVATSLNKKFLMSRKTV